MLTNQLSKELAAFLGKYLEFYNEFVTVEQDKFDAISAGDTKKIDLIVVKEQALMLQSRGFELQREDLIKREVDKNTTLREIVALADDEVRPEIERLYKELCEMLLDLKDINARSNALTKLKLHEIDQNLRKLEKRDAPIGYGALGSTNNNHSRVISRKV